MENLSGWFLIIFIQYYSAPQIAGCQLPNECKFDEFHLIDAPWCAEFVAKNEFKRIGLKCNLKSGSQSLDFYKIYLEQEDCEWKEFIELKSIGPTPSLRKIIDTRNFVHFMSSINDSLILRLSNFKSIDLDLFDMDTINYTQNGYELTVDSKSIPGVLNQIDLVNVRFDFYIEDLKIKTCDDLINSNLAYTRSIFQINANYYLDKILLFKCEFRTPICPVVFKNTKVYDFYMVGMADTFFKREYLKFSGENLDNLNSKIKYIFIYNCENLNINLDMFNPSVFKELRALNIFSSIRKIEANIFRVFQKMYYLQFEVSSLRRMLHAEGTHWIQAINADIKVNMSDMAEIESYLDWMFNIELRFYHEISVPSVFPDEDFCLYENFPLDRMVVLFIKFESYSVPIPDDYQMQFSCTYLWLIRYYPILAQFFTDKSWDSLIIEYNLKSNASKPVCDFDMMASRCDKNRFQLKPIWNIVDTSYLNVAFKFVFTILLYPISLIGVFTNLMVILVIVSKKNKEIFKGLKQYTYLGLNSLFNMMILVIQILSFLSDCSFAMLCPDTRRFIIVQFFKIVFKEGLLVALRFMCNFTYVAFSVNRISLLDKKNPKIVEWVTGISVSKYLLLTGVISVVFSVVKVFKYKVNYDNAELSYPTPMESDIWASSTWQKDAYFITSSVCDLVNYVVFAFVNLSIDVVMVVKLRKILIEKATKFRKLNLHPNKESNADKSKSKGEETLAKAIKMVVLNNVIAFLFKLPLSINPVANTVAEFYYHTGKVTKGYLIFKVIYERFNSSGLYDLIPAVSECLFAISLTIQILVYIRFDRKFKIAYEQLMKRPESSYLKNV